MATPSTAQMSDAEYLQRVPQAHWEGIFDLIYTRYTLVFNELLSMQHTSIFKIVANVFLHSIKRASTWLETRFMKSEDNVHLLNLLNGFLLGNVMSIAHLSFDVFAKYWTTISSVSGQMARLTMLASFL